MPKSVVAETAQKLLVNEICSSESSYVVPITPLQREHLTNWCWLFVTF